MTDLIRPRPLCAGLLLIGLIGLAGCQALVPASWKRPAGETPAPVSARSTLDADDLFAYTQHMLMLNHDDLLQEINQRRDRAQQQHLALDKAKLAIALTLPYQGQRDTTKALLAISEVPREDSALGPHANVLVAYTEALLAYQARQEEMLQAVLQPDKTPAPVPVGGNTTPPAEVANLQALAQRLRTDQKRNESQIEALNTRLREEKARADGLQQKIDALGNLEKSLAERKAQRGDTTR